MNLRTKVVKAGISLFLLIAFTPSHSGAIAADWPKTMSFPSGRVGTSVYAVVVGMSQLISKYTGVKTVPQAGAPTRNLILLHKKEVELALGFNDSSFAAVRGVDEFKDFGKINVRLLFSNSVPTPVAFITRRDANIRTVEDLRGKNVMCIYPPSSTFTMGANMLLEAVGMSHSDIKAMSFSGNPEGSAALKERRVAAYIHVQTVTSVIPFVQDLNNEVPLRLVGVPEVKLNAILPKYPYFNRGVLPARIYGDIVDNKDLVSAGVIDNIICHGDLPEDLVHGVMKAIFDHVEELLPVHPVAKVWVAKPLASAVLPYHAGAVMYYKEKGLWTKEIEQKQQQLLTEVGASK